MMPRGDRTGPAGMGPMTGRSAGYCAGFPTPGFTRPGRPFGGRGRGRRNMYYATGLPGWARMGYQQPMQTPVDAESERDMLRQEADMLKKDLEDIHKRLEELADES